MTFDAFVKIGGNVARKNKSQSFGDDDNVDPNEKTVDETSENLDETSSGETGTVFSAEGVAAPTGNVEDYSATSEPVPQSVKEQENAEKAEVAKLEKAVEAAKVRDAKWKKDAVEDKKTYEEEQARKKELSEKDPADMTTMEKVELGLLQESDIPLSDNYWNERTQAQIARSQQAAEEKEKAILTARKIKDRPKAEPVEA